MTSLSEFLVARLDEDERLAKAAGEGIRSTWTYDPDDAQSFGEIFIRDPGEPGIRAAGALLGSVTYGDNGPSVEAEQATHIARHDPARVLREVEAKRRILAKYRVNDGGWGGGTGPVDWAKLPHARAGANYALWDSIRMLATAYSDHPDYNPAWSE